MKIEVDNLTLRPTVTLNESDLKRAFTSESEFIKLLHEITRECYGESLANLCFPLKEVNE